MFLEYYGLREQPFGVTPNPRYLYHSPMHREALASLIYGIEADLGFSALIAEPGTGKTTLLFYLLEKFRKTARTALIFQTLCSPVELLRYLASEFEIQTNETDPVLLNERIKEVLVREAAARRRVIVIIDEAQNLDESVLETIRLLSDFETQNFKLMHIVLAGQLQLAEKLARPSMAQLLQRVSMVNRLNPLTPEETRNYIEYRLNVAGYHGTPLFTLGAVELISSMSGGVPRKINRICFNALSLGCAVGKRTIDDELIKEVGSDLDIGDLLFAKGAITDEVSQQPAPGPANDAHSRTSNVGRLPQPEPAIKRGDHPGEGAATTNWPAFPVAAPRTRHTMPTHTVSTPVTFTPVRPLTGSLGATAVASHAMAPKPFPKPAPEPEEFPIVRPVGTEPVRRSAAKKENNRPFRPMILAIAALLAAVMGLAGWTLFVKSPAHNNENSTQSSPQLQSGQEVNLPPADPPTAQINEGIERGRSAVRRKPQVPVKVTARSLEGSTTEPAGSMVVDFGRARPSVASSQGARAISAALIRKVQPVYPAEARRSGIEGSVTVSAVIGTDGKPKNVQAISGDPVLARAATDAVSQWLYQPYRVNGRPVEVETEVVVDFALR